MTLESISDITPNGTATPLSATAIKATWVRIAASGSTIRVGDSLVGAARGVLLQTGVVTELPRIDAVQGFYDLSRVYVYGTGADKVSITYGV
jgi:hypothetical protein